MLVLEVPAVICGVDNFDAVALFGQFNAAGLLTVPELPYGIPSHNMPERICVRRDAARMEKGLRDWVAGHLGTDRRLGRGHCLRYSMMFPEFAVGQEILLAYGTPFVLA